MPRWWEKEPTRGTTRGARAGAEGLEGYSAVISKSIPLNWARLCLPSILSTNHPCLWQARAPVPTICEKLHELLEGAPKTNKRGCIYISTRGTPHLSTLPSKRQRCLLGHDMHGLQVHEYISRITLWLKKGLPADFVHQPTNYLVHHSCKHPWCCNPAHLAWMQVPAHASLHGACKRGTRRHPL
jgi:hypothetical protein